MLITVDVINLLGGREKDKKEVGDTVITVEENTQKTRRIEGANYEKDAGRNILPGGEVVGQQSSEGTTVNIH